MRKTALFRRSGRKGKIQNPLCRKYLTPIRYSGQAHKTGINIAASQHFVAALPNTHYFEYCVEQGALRQTLTKQRFPVIDGDISVPEEPGLGIELDEEVVARYRVG